MLLKKQNKTKNSLLTIIGKVGYKFGTKSSLLYFKEWEFREEEKSFQEKHSGWLTEKNICEVLCTKKKKDNFHPDHFWDFNIFRKRILNILPLILKFWYKKVHFQYKCHDLGYFHVLFQTCIRLFHFRHKKIQIKVLTTRFTSSFLCDKDRTIMCYIGWRLRGET